jgi:threonyl-tRNA synthetase
MLVVGDREAEAGTVSVRHRKHADMGAKPVDEFIADVKALVDLKVAHGCGEGYSPPRPGRIGKT